MKNSDFFFKTDHFGVRLASADDLSAMIQCETEAWSTDSAADPEIIKKRLKFHSGTTFVLEDINSNSIVGFFMCVPAHTAACEPFFPWSYYAEMSLLPAESSWIHLYGVSLTVIPQAPKYAATTLLNGIAHWLSTSKFLTFALGMRLPGYKDYFSSSNLSAASYVDLALKHMVPEKGFGACIQSGATFLGIQEEYYDDPESLNNGAIMMYVKPSRYTASYTLNASGEVHEITPTNGYVWLMKSFAKLEGSSIQKSFITNSDGDIVWNGFIRSNGLVIEVGLLFDNQTFVALSDFQSVLTPIDRGLSYLVHEEIEKILGEAVEYFSNTNCQLFTQTGKVLSCSLTDQEELKELSEIFIEVLDLDLDIGELIILSIDLFEKTHFFFAAVAEVFDDGVILTLTKHCYRSSKRESYRFKVENIKIKDGFDILEISDSGLRVIVNDNANKDFLEVRLEDEVINFKVVYSISVSTEKNILGLQLCDKNQRSLNAWYKFLIKVQFPLLEKREPSTHGAAWELLAKTGFISGEFGELMNSRKESIFSEWALQDTSESKYGLTVLGWDNGAPVSTIGVAKVSSNTWVTQAAAVIDNPEYLKFTQSMYVWRIRQMLQFPDLLTYTAIFDANKKFLDRFFRKFFLSQKLDQEKRIKWNEFSTFYCKADGLFNADNFSPNENSAFPYRKDIEELLEETGDSLLTSTIEKNSALYMYSRPHLHLAQPMSGVFLESEKDFKGLDPLLLNRFIETKNDLFTVYFKLNPELDRIEGFPNAEIKRDEQMIIWLCPREFLPDFLSNTLKSLVDMFRKYGAKNVA